MTPRLIAGPQTGLFDSLPMSHDSFAGMGVVPGVNAYVPPYPIFQVTTTPIVMNEGNPDAGNSPVAIDVPIYVQNLKTTASISWWVTADGPTAYWPAGSLPGGTFQVSGNGHLTFDALTYTPDNTPQLDSTITLHFYPAGGITMAGYGDVQITILDDDSPFDGDNDNTITASSGNDVINARGGNDTVHAGAGNDQISGGDGNDVLAGGGGADYIRGDVGDNVMSGNGGADTFLGADGSDTINGGRGDDFMDAGLGANIMTGGAGADTFRFSTYFTESSNEITDFTPGTDHIQISLSAWHAAGPLGFENHATPTLDGPELVFNPANHTLYYAPYGGTDDPTTSPMYAVAVLDNVAKLAKIDFIFAA